MSRYKMIADTKRYPSVYKVVDTERPIAIPRTVDKEYPVFNPLCECVEEGTAMQIADALNKADM